MNILCIGDIVGKPGRHAVESLLVDLKEQYEVDFVIANGENSAGGSGLTAKTSEQLLHCGCDVLTSGDHIWDQKDFKEYLDATQQVIRPANFPNGAPGKGWTIRESAAGVKVGVINLLGRVFMRYQVDCPFRELESIIAKIKKVTPIIIVDMHAETTSEKNAMGHFADGKVSAIFGTHTHIQTADDRILPKGTGYITDLGMTGPYDSVIGQDKEIIVKRFLTSVPIRFQVAEGQVKLGGAVFDIDEKTGKAKSITRILRDFEYE